MPGQTERVYEPQRNGGDIEIINIEHHQRRLMMKALNRYKNDEEAAAALGIDKRTLVRWKKDFKVVRKKIYVYYSNL